MVENVFAWLQEWAQVISGLGSLLLTVGLVYLYWQQKDLLRRDLNREVRQNHTETLRRRIRAWHGDIDELGASDDGSFFSDETNLPRVRGASVEPAPPLLNVVGNDADFRVVPEAIEDDRYLRDLLENHAPELRELKEKIEGQYQEFQQARDDFCAEFSDGRTVVEDEYTLCPTEYFDEWVFEQVVLLHRDHLRKDKEKLRAIAEDSVSDERASNPEDWKLFYTADARGSRRMYTYEARFESEELFDEYGEYSDEIEKQVLAVYCDVIDDIGSEGVYGHGVVAAEVLDEMAQSIEELKAKLVEFEGHPLYMGDCPYLDETTL